MMCVSNDILGLLYCVVPTGDYQCPVDRLLSTIL